MSALTLPPDRIRTFLDPVLHRPAVEVAEVDTRVVALVERMRRAMAAGSGIGLAAPQIGVSSRVLVWEVAQPPPKWRMGGPSSGSLINPVVVAFDGDRPFTEGCLSLPGMSVSVHRPERCTVVAFDLTGREIVRELDGIVARIVLHELDHLDGVLMDERGTAAVSGEQAL